MEHADPEARAIPECLHQARRSRHALADGFRDGPPGFGAVLGAAGQGMAALSRYLHRRLRPRPRDVRKQFPGRQGDVQLCEFVERVQARRRELLGRREKCDVPQHRAEILSVVVAGSSSRICTEKRGSWDMISKSLIFGATLVLVASSAA